MKSLTLEGLTVNPIAYDLLLEQPWHPQAAVNLQDWVAATGGKFATNPQGDACETAKRLLAKYRGELVTS